MKTIRFTHLFTAAFSLAAFSTASCADKDKTADALPPAKTVAAAPAAPTPVAPVAPVARAAVPEAPAASWADIKEFTYDQRAQFFAGLKKLEARVDEQISELTAIRATRKSSANTQDWDFAMKEMVNARANLMGAGEVSGKATPETWDQQKERVGQAWVRTQDAYAKVKASTTT
jgi:hypothetical protein